MTTEQLFSPNLGLDWNVCARCGQVVCDHLQKANGDRVCQLSSKERLYAIAQRLATLSDAIRPKLTRAEHAELWAIINQIADVSFGKIRPAPETPARIPDGYAYRYPYSSGGTYIVFEPRADRDAIEAIPYFFGASAKTPECSTCNDTGEVDEMLGGIARSDPHAPCPDCRPVKAPTVPTMKWDPCSSGGLWICTACDASYCSPPWSQKKAAEHHATDCTGKREPL